MVGVAKPQFSPPRPIRPNDGIRDFACGYSDLDDWLRINALKSEGKTARAYVVCDGSQVVAYYCLATGGVGRDLAPGKVRRNAPNPVPVVVIGRLAVTRTHQQRGLGEAMLRDAIRRALTASEIVGCAAILVHAIDDPAAAFYERHGFMRFPIEARTLFLPLDTLRASLQAPLPTPSPRRR